MSSVRTRRIYEPPAVADLVDRARGGVVTLLDAARDERHNNAVVLRELVEERLGAPQPSPGTVSRADTNRHQV